MSKHRYQLLQPVLRRRLRRPRRRGRPRHSARGSLLVEATVAITVTAALLVGATRVITLAVKQARSLAQRRAAAEELGNLMEVAFAIPWAELSADRIRAEGFGDPRWQEPPAWQLSVEVAPQDGIPAVRRIDIEIAWQGGALRGEPLTLTAWRYRQPDRVASASPTE